MSETGMISFSSSKTASAKVAKLSCISSVEEEQIAGTNPPANDLVAYIATVQDTGNIEAATAECANKMKRISGVTVTRELSFLGIVSFEASAAHSLKVEKLSCVATVELDRENNPLPSTRVGN